MNEHVDELLALYALGGLETDEAQRVEAHLARCEACRAEAGRQQQLVLAVAAAVPPQAPDPRAKERLLARVGAAATDVARPQANWLALPRWVLAGLSLALALLAGWNVFLTQEINSLQRQVRGSTGAVALISSPDTAAITLEGRGTMPAASGQAYVDFDSQDVVLVVRHLEPLPAGKTYQAWVVSDEGPQSAGFVDVTGNGWGMRWLDVPFVSGGWVCVSVEPSGGSQQPSDVVLWGGE